MKIKRIQYFEMLWNNRPWENLNVKIILIKYVLAAMQTI